MNTKLKMSALAAKRALVALPVAVFVALAVVFGGANSFAQTVNQSTNTLKVSPVRSDIEINPGMSKTIPMAVTNLTKSPITVRPFANDFVSGDERGTPALILDEKKFAPSHSLKRFMAPLKDVTIPAGEAKTINVTISVPKDARPGGYFGAVRFAPTTPESGGQVNVNTSVASLILLTVPGKVLERAELTDFAVQQNGKPGQFFGSANDVQVTARLLNDSDVQVGPFGKLTVKKGNEVVYETDFNNKNPRDMVLPDSARRWDIPLDKISDFGNYTVSATFTYGKNNQTIEATTSFWMIPVRLVVAVAIGLLVFIGGCIGMWLSYSKKKIRAPRAPRGDSHKRY